MAQMPVLERLSDGMKMYQSNAICRYLAKKVRLAGADDYEAYLVDCAVDTINDFRASKHLFTNLKCQMFFYCKLDNLSVIVSIENN
jgi:glutathione S-transferase